MYLLTTAHFYKDLLISYSIQCIGFLKNLQKTDQNVINDASTPA